MVEGFKKYNGVGFKDQVLCCIHWDLFLNFLMSIFWFLIPPFSFFSKLFFLFNCFVRIFSFLNKFSPFLLFIYKWRSIWWRLLCLMIWVSTHLRISMIKTSLSLILALVDIKEQSFKYLDTWMGLNYIRNNMWKGRRDGGDWCHL